MRISAEARFVVAKLSADVENSLVIVVLSVFLVSSERDSGKAVEMLVRSFTMGCESYCRITGAVGPAAQQLRRGAFVQQQVLVGRDAPARQAESSSAGLSLICLRPSCSGGSSMKSARPPPSTYFLMASTSGWM